MRPLALLIGLCLAQAACGGGTPPATTPTANVMQEAIARQGDITVRASAIPTATLAPEIAARYGLQRDPRRVMLLVAVRRGPDAQERPLPARITATATNLSGQREEIVLRELRSDSPGTATDLLDYVGTAAVAPPDTLRFDLTVLPEGGGTLALQFSREFHPLQARPNPR